jgi:hypothetical protein
MTVVDRTRWPAVGGYIRRQLPELHRVILERAWRDVEIAETPPGSNLGVRIELYLRRADVPDAEVRAGRGYWCAAWVAAVWEDAGAAVPPSARASCDAWGNWAKREGLWIPARDIGPRGVAEGSVVLYGTPTDLSHIGIVTRWDQHYRRSLEGNTTATGFSRNGTLVAFKTISTQLAQGYVRPRAA